MLCSGRDGIPRALPAGFLFIPICQRHPQPSSAFPFREQLPRHIKHEKEQKKRVVDPNLIPQAALRAQLTEIKVPTPLCCSGKEHPIKIMAFTFFFLLVGIAEWCFGLAPGALDAVAHLH